MFACYLCGIDFSSLSNYTFKIRMKVTKHYENDHVIIYVEEGETKTCITLESDRQMRRLGECLLDLYRTDAREVTIEPPSV